MAVPRAIDKKYSATICVWKRSGASFVVTDSPGGEMNSSATVNTNRISTIASSGVELGAPFAHGRNSRNATPMIMAPSENFTGADGARVPSFVQIAAKTPERMITKIGLMELTQGIGISQPKIIRLRRSSE